VHRPGVAHGEFTGFEALVRGTNQSGVRAHNERLVLTLVRQQGPLSKAQIARMTGLSAQTVSVIMRALEADGLLVKGEPVRGRVGQPSVPIGLAGGGAYFLGLKIGRRSVELVLANFVGEIVARAHLTYQYPTPAGTIRFAEGAILQLAGQLDPAERAKIAGLGIAMPFRIWDWARTIGLPPGSMAEWEGLDIRAEIAAVCSYPVYLQNDASAACGAELVFGRSQGPTDFLYFYIGYFVGGGIVLQDRLYSGHSGNAGALGSMPVPGQGGRVVQLIDTASLFRLERALREAGHETQSLWLAPDGWSVDADVLADWVEEAAGGLAHAIASACSVIDFEAVLIDGWLPAALRRRLVEATQARLGAMNLAGIEPPEVREGTIGPDARALGAASLPLSERFLVEPQAAALPA
jgi:predicted NBD/HSP70 family sugar kinase/biotin operon repressor